jgi:hypothetical protein
LAPAVLWQHEALACGAAFSCGAAEGGFWIAVCAQDATARARTKMNAVDLNFMMISYVYVVYVYDV